MSYFNNTDDAMEVHDTSDECLGESESDSDYEVSSSEETEEKVGDAGTDEGLWIPISREEPDSSTVVAEFTAGSDEDGTGEGLWMPISGEDPGPGTFDFTAVPGPKHMPPQDASPMQYVSLFFTDEFFKRVVEETNHYSHEWVETHADYLREHPASMMHQWVKHSETSVEELKAFLGVLFNMGLIGKPTIASYWDTCHPSHRTPWFNEHFARDRFLLLLKFLHFNGMPRDVPDGDCDDKLFKILPVIKHFNEAFSQYYYPKVDINIDEGIVGFKGKTPHLRRPHKRHAHLGVKMWCVCESQTGYTLHFEVCKGRETKEPVSRHGFTHDLAMRLLRKSGVLNKGHHLGIDNFFASPDLLLDLYAHGTTATGTVRRNRGGLPRADLREWLGNHQVTERRKGALLCVAYRDGGKKPIFLSTSASAGFVATINRRNQKVQKPEIVMKYNSAMGGVDLSDARLYKYLSERRTLKWTLKVAFTIFGRALLNAFLLYDLHTSHRPKLDRHHFMMAVVDGLAGDFFSRHGVSRRRSAAEMEVDRQNPLQPAHPPVNLFPGHELRKLPQGKYRECKGHHDKRKRTCLECPACNVGLCSLCFTSYHRKKFKKCSR